MPWSIRDDHPDCDGFAVVNDDTGELTACHDTREQAEKHQAALYANVPDARSAQIAAALDPDKPTFRSVAFDDIDVAADGGKFVGYAAVFDDEANIAGMFTESIQRGAFRKVLAKGQNVPMLYDHNPGLPALATTRGGTLRLKEDERGLRVEADVADHFIGHAVRELVKRGDISGMSFGFVAGKGNSKMDTRRTPPHRSLIGFERLLDVSPTWDPAYDSTSAELRSLIAASAVIPGSAGWLQEGDDDKSVAAVTTQASWESDEPEAEERSGEGEQSGADWRIQFAARQRRLEIATKGRFTP